MIAINKPPIPGMLWGHYPEKTDSANNEGVFHHLAHFNSLSTLKVASKAKRVLALVRQAEKHMPAYNTCICAHWTSIYSC